MARALLNISTMKLFSSAVVIAGLALGSIAFGQDPAPKPQSDTPSVSVTGCLVKGETPNNYVVTDQKSGDKLPFSGPATLDKYVNQTVTLTGTVATQGQDKVFKPQKIEQVSPSCEKGK
jgi:hypothetical protein